MLRETHLVNVSQHYKVINISLDLGKTLQDVKFADCSGGYTYQSGNDLSATKVRNRFIFWRSHQCSLELIEESLDCQLRNNRVKLVFSDTPVLDVQFVEVGPDVYLLVCTTGGLVRFLLHHPDQLKEAECAYSVLHSVSSASYQVCQLPAAPFRSQIRCASAWLNQRDCSALFAYSLSGGEIQLMEMPPQQSQQRQQITTAGQAMELRQNTLFDRLLGGWMSSSRTWDGGLSPDAVTGMTFWSDPSDPGDTVCLLSASRDHKLRVWDVARRGECHFALDLLQCVPDGDRQVPPALQNKGHQVRLLPGREPVVCVYVNLVDRTYFVILDGVLCNQRLQLQQRRVLASLGHNLLDFVIDRDKLWAMYIDENDGASHELHGHGLDDYARITRCQLMESESYQLLPEDHNSLVSRVFSGSRYSLASIQRSLRLFLDENSLHQYIEQLDNEESTSSSPASLELLKAVLIDSVECLVQEEACENDEIEEEEEAALNSLRSRYLENFYGKLSQLHAMDSAVCGIFAACGIVCIVRRQFIGFARPTDLAERCHLAGRLEVADVSDLPSLEDGQGVRDFLSVADACRRLAGCLLPGSLDYLMAEAAEYNDDDYSALIGSFRRRYLSSAEQRRLCLELADELAGAYEPVSALSSLVGVIESLDYAEELRLELLDQAGEFVGDEQLLASWPAAELVCNSVCQSVDSRLRLGLCCLLLLSELPGSFAGLAEHLFARASDSVRGLCLQHWLGQQVYAPAPAKLLETVQCQLQLMLAKPDDALNYAKIARAFNNATVAVDCPMLQVWYVCSAGKRLRRPLRARLAEEEATDVTLGGDLLPAAGAIMQHMLSPERGGFNFPLFLMWSGQLDQLITYTGMCRRWIRGDPGYLHALRGLALLNMPAMMVNEQSESEIRAEAVACMVHAVQSSVTCAQPAGFETFLKAVGVDASEASADPQTSRSRLFLHLVRVLELMRCSEQIVSLARTALTHAAGCKKFEIPLLSTVFKHEVELGRFQSAFDAMMSLEDSSIQLDCLRHLVVTLFDKGQMRTLLEFNFGQLADAFVNVVEMRARAVDADMHLYYNLLYCYHSNRCDYRRAALAMHELSVRLSCDSGFEATQRQARALLTAIGSLRMLEQRHQWVVVPEDYLDDAAIGRPDSPRGIRVLTLVDLERRYRSLSAQLQLSLRQPPSAGAGGGGRSGDEIIADLLTAGLYYEAKCLLMQSDKPPTPLFEALATAAVTASGFVSVTKENLTALKEALEEEGQSAEGASPADCLWQLLQVYVKRYDFPGAPGVNAVAQRLLLLDYPAPTWLTDLHRERDPAGLLRLLILHDKVEEAHELCVSLLDSARVSLESGAGQPNHCLPYTHILQVDNGLRQLARSSGPGCQAADRMHRQLRRSIELYWEELAA